MKANGITAMSTPQVMRVAKKRLDSEIVRRKLAKSRTVAQTLIRNDKVLVNGKAAEKANQMISATDSIQITEGLKYVSRGGVKLEAALEQFGVSVRGLVCLDVGSSTGGFTDCLLQRGAELVYAFDVGTDQFDKNLRVNPKVVLREQTDIRTIKKLQYAPQVAVIDVSFISLSHILPHVYQLMQPNGAVLALVKPQFELEAEALNKKGVVTHEVDKLRALDKVKVCATISGFKIVGDMRSPIEGGEGNVEYFLYLQKWNDKHVGSGLKF